MTAPLTLQAAVQQAQAQGLPALRQLRERLRLVSQDDDELTSTTAASSSPTASGTSPEGSSSSGSWTTCALLLLFRWLAAMHATQILPHQACMHVSCTCIMGSAGRSKTLGTHLLHTGIPLISHCRRISSRAFMLPDLTPCIALDTAGSSGGSEAMLDIHSAATPMKPMGGQPMWPDHTGGG
jgi:hypothetical protein